MTKCTASNFPPSVSLPSPPSVPAVPEFVAGPECPLDEEV